MEAGYSHCHSKLVVTAIMEHSCSSNNKNMKARLAGVKIKCVYAKSNRGWIEVNFHDHSKVPYHDITAAQSRLYPSLGAVTCGRTSEFDHVEEKYDEGPAGLLPEIQMCGPVAAESHE